jgi:hypothetical protein
MRSTLFTLILLCLIPFTSKAQKLEFEGEFLLFREAKTKQPVLIINDSLVYKGFAMKRIAFKHTEYPAKLQEYKFFNIGSKTYLVHDGCGPVLEYRNDSIVRIDNSFLHRNQYKASHFIYKKEIYFFGGYGLFTTKNILTKFDFKTGEWIEVQTIGNEKVEPRESAFSFVKGNNFYVFAGTTKDINNVPDVVPTQNILWSLNLPKMKWTSNGIFNPIIQNLKSESNFYSNETSFFISKSFHEINIKTNKIYKFETKFFPNIQYFYMEGEKVIGVFQNNHGKYFEALNIRDLKGKLKSTASFITTLNQTNNLYNALFYLIIIVLLTFTLFFRKKIKNILKPFNGVIFLEKKQCFLYKRKVILFEEQEKIVLNYLLNHINEFISLNELNQLFERNNQFETISATVKRREQAVSSLLIKVSKITGIEEDKLLLERKNSEDKRIKDVLLLPNLLKKVEE